MRSPAVRPESGGTVNWQRKRTRCESSRASRLSSRDAGSCRRTRFDRTSAPPRSSISPEPVACGSGDQDGSPSPLWSPSTRTSSVRPSGRRTGVNRCVPDPITRTRAWRASGGIRPLRNSPRSPAHLRVRGAQDQFIGGAEGCRSRPLPGDPGAGVGPGSGTAETRGRSCLARNEGAVVAVRAPPDRRVAPPASRSARG